MHTGRVLTIGNHAPSGIVPIFITPSCPHEDCVRLTYTTINDRPSRPTFCQNCRNPKNQTQRSVLLLDKEPRYIALKGEATW
jgi:hypothetical protein